MYSVLRERIEDLELADDFHPDVRITRRPTELWMLGYAAQSGPEHLIKFGAVGRGTVAFQPVVQNGDLLPLRVQRPDYLPSHSSMALFAFAAESVRLSLMSLLPFAMDAYCSLLSLYGSRSAASVPIKR